MGQKARRPRQTLSFGRSGAGPGPRSCAQEPGAKRGAGGALPRHPLSGEKKNRAGKHQPQILSLGENNYKLDKINVRNAVEGALGGERRRKRNSPSCLSTVPPSPPRPRMEPWLPGPHPALPAAARCLALISPGHQRGWGRWPVIRERVPPGLSR